jgi:hypothetical protein
MIIKHDARQSGTARVAHKSVHVEAEYLAHVLSELGSPWPIYRRDSRVVRTRGHGWQVLSSQRNGPRCAHRNPRSESSRVVSPPMDFSWRALGSGSPEHAAY